MQLSFITPDVYPMAKSAIAEQHVTNLRQRLRCARAKVKKSLTGRPGNCNLSPELKLRLAFEGAQHGH